MAGHLPHENSAVRITEAQDNAVLEDDAAMGYEEQDLFNGVDPVFLFLRFDLGDHYLIVDDVFEDLSVGASTLGGLLKAWPAIS